MYQHIQNEDQTLDHQHPHPHGNDNNNNNNNKDNKNNTDSMTGGYESIAVASLAITRAHLLLQQYQQASRTCQQLLDAIHRYKSTSIRSKSLSSSSSSTATTTATTTTTAIDSNIQQQVFQTGRKRSHQQQSLSLGGTSTFFMTT